MSGLVMSRLATSGLLLTLSFPCVALAGDDIAVGQMAFPKIGAKATVDGKEVDAFESRVPPLVDEIDGERLRIGRMWMAKRDVLPIEAAMEYYSDQIENRDGPWARSGRSVVWLCKEKYREAIADVDEAIRLNPNQPWTYCIRAGADMQ